MKRQVHHGRMHKHREGPMVPWGLFSLTAVQYSLSYKHREALSYKRHHVVGSVTQARKKLNTQTQGEYALATNSAMDSTCGYAISRSAARLS
jgi:hypothetical protein